MSFFRKWLKGRKGEDSSRKPEPKDMQRAVERQKRKPPILSPDCSVIRTVFGKTKLFFGGDGVTLKYISTEMPLPEGCRKIPFLDSVSQVLGYYKVSEGYTTSDYDGSRTYTYEGKVDAHLFSEDDHREILGLASKLGMDVAMPFRERGGTGRSEVSKITKADLLKSCIEGAAVVSGESKGRRVEEAIGKIISISWYTLSKDVMCLNTDYGRHVLMFNNFANLIDEKGVSVISSIPVIQSGQIDAELKVGDETRYITIFPLRD